MPIRETGLGTLDNRYLKLDASNDPITGSLTIGDGTDENIDWASGNVTYVPIGGDIATYITAATAGDTLVLSSGNFAISAQINIAKAINIVGQGIGQTTITHTATEATDYTFYVTAANVRLANFSLVMSHATGTSFAIGIGYDGSAGSVLSGGYITNVNVDVDSSAAAVIGININEYAVTIRDCVVDVATTGTNKNADGVKFQHNNTAETTSTSYGYNIHSTASGSGTSTRSSAFTVADNSATQNLAVYMYECYGYGTGSSTLEVGAYATGDNAYLFARGCYFRGDDFDIAQASSAIFQVSNCILLSGTVSGTITQDGTVACEEVFTPTIKSDLVSATDIHIDCGTDKTVVLDIPVWDDLPPTPIVTARLGSAAPTLATFKGNVEQYTFDATNDYVIGNQEILHWYKEGTDLRPHVHWSNNGSAASAFTVKWAMEYTLSNATTDTTAASAFGNTVTITGSTTYASGTADRKHFLTELETISGTNIKIGNVITYKFYRAAADTAPDADPFALQIGFHAQRDTLGSRGVATK